MLFDPKRMKQWESKPVSNLEALAAWLDTQPGRRKYNIDDPRRCLAAEFIQATRPGEEYCLTFFKLREFMEGHVGALIFGRKTYGAARRRIKMILFWQWLTGTKTKMKQE